MLTSKSLDQLISKITCIGLLIGILSTNLFLNGQSQKVQAFKNVKKEVDREIAIIQKTITRLKTEKIVTPIMFMGTGIAVTAVVMAALFLFSGLKLGKAINEMQNKFVDIKRNSGFDIQADEYWVQRALATVKNLPEKAVQEAQKRVFSKATQNTSGTELIKDVIETVLKPKQSRLFFWTFFSSVIGIFGTAMVSLGSFFRSSKIPVTEAYDSVEKIEQIKKKYPEILTPQQNFVLAQLKMLSKGIIIGKIIKNVRLEDALMKTVDETIQQHFLLALAFSKKEESRTIFTTYIKLKYQEELYEQMLSEDVSIIKSFFTKFQLRRIKKKIAKLETLHPHIRVALEHAVQIYTKKVNAILEELRT